MLHVVHVCVRACLLRRWKGERKKIKGKENMEEEGTRKGLGKDVRKKQRETRKFL